MTFLLAAIIFILSMVVFMFTVSNILLFLFFALPFTKKLEKASLLVPNSLFNSYLVALIFQIVALSLYTLPFYFLFPQEYFISVLVGYGLGAFEILMKVRSFGLNLSNFSKYFERNKDLFWPELSSKYNENPQQLLEFILSAVK